MKLGDILEFEVMEPELRIQKSAVLGHQDRVLSVAQRWDHLGSGGWIGPNIDTIYTNLVSDRYKPCENDYLSSALVCNVVV